MRPVGGRRARHLGSAPRSVEEQLSEPLDQAAYLFGNLTLLVLWAPERIYDLGDSRSSEVRRADCVCLVHARARGGGAIARSRQLREALEQGDELRERKRPFDGGGGVDDGRVYVRPLEAEHEVERREVQLREGACAVRREVEVERSRELQRLRKRRQGTELQDADRGRADRCLIASRRERRGCKRAPEAVARADEDDAELVSLG